MLTTFPSEYVQAGTSQQQQQQQQTSVDYKSGELMKLSNSSRLDSFLIISEDEIWVEKAIDIGTGAAQSDTSPKTRSSTKNSAAYKANCLTPRSCPGKKRQKITISLVY